MGDEDIALVCRLMQEDAEEFLSNSTRKGKQVEGSETDVQVAFRLFLEESKITATAHNDLQITTRMMESLQLDDDAISQHQTEQHSAESNQNLPLTLSNGDNSSEASGGRPQVNSEPVTYDDDDDDDDDELTTLFFKYSNQLSHDNILDQPESSSWAASRKPQTTKICEACRDQKEDLELFRVPCLHEYCLQCIAQIIRIAIKDEALFPPRCCGQQIPLTTIIQVLDDDELEEFHQKTDEYSTPRRTYCHNRACARFIPATNYENDTATCDLCGSKTCITCKEASHDGDCPNDEELQQVMQVATDQNWQRCQNCSALVELNMGCYHMTCRCGHQFCYLCGAKWKTCKCPQWDETLLLVGPPAPAQFPVRFPIQFIDRVARRLEYERAIGRQARRDLVEPDHGEMVRQAALQIHRLMDEIRREQMAQEIIGDFRAPAANRCNHAHWTSRGGRRECARCGDTMRMFIYECRQCHTWLCRSCRHSLNHPQQ
ncbi:hypothetical protein F4804DRAFT_344958 [Jackrogersella minutella]|nr:hypothetical protein F4804DRAFT_344958 [Jackrogersella minutella]